MMSASGEHKSCVKVHENTFHGSRFRICSFLEGFSSREATMKSENLSPKDKMVEDKEVCQSTLVLHT